ncbi:MAG: winged helix-turn-helix transcriptional regulator, partial [Bacteroidales bacterium]|nr:winged helix-turn-helix transcriptional regulator [Bacteroidales bacterium]
VNGDVNGGVNGDVNGDVNGGVNGDVNGDVNGGVNGDVNGDVNGGVNGDVNSGVKTLSGSLREVYLIVLNKPGIKIKQIAEIRKKSKSTVGKQLAELRKRGFIEYLGSDKTGGYYVK